MRDRTAPRAVDDEQTVGVPVDEHLLEEICVTSNVESHRYLNEAKASGGSSIVMLTILVLLLPTITAPTRPEGPRSPHCGAGFREERVLIRWPLARSCAFPSI